MKLKFGIYEYSRRQGKDVPCIWDSDTLVNPHILVCGKSGSGKSYTLRNMISAFEQGGVKVHVFDPHGDMSTNGESSQLFSSKYRIGYNPLEIETHEHAGGVRKTINNFLYIIQSHGRSLGNRQVDVLRNLLTDLYKVRGIYESNSQTWSKKQINADQRSEYIRRGEFSRLYQYYPTLDDLKQYADNKFNTLFSIGDEDSKEGRIAMQALKSCQNLVAKMRKDLASVSGLNSELEKQKIYDKVAAAKEEAKAKYNDFLANLQPNSIDDTKHFESKETLRSVLVRIEELINCGIFSSNPPNFDSSSLVWRYSMQYLSDPEKVMLVYYCMEKIFRNRVNHGETDRLKEVIIVDEAHKFITEDGNNIFNIIAKEARKFGLALICASQNPEHFSQDFLTTVATKVLLGVDPVVQNKISNTWAVKKEVLSQIVATQCIAVYMDRKRSANPCFKGVLVSY